MSDKSNVVEIAGKTAGLLSVVKIGLESILHGFKIYYFVRNAQQRCTGIFFIKFHHKISTLTLTGEMRLVGGI